MSKTTKTHGLKSKKCDKLRGTSKQSWHYHEDGGITVCIAVGEGKVGVARIPAKSIRVWSDVDNARRRKK